MVFRFRVFCLHRLTSILQRKEEVPRGGGGGGTLIFVYIRRLGSFFLVQNFEFQYSWGVFRKTVFWGGMKILWIFFWGHFKIGLHFGVISMHFRVFS